MKPILILGGSGLVGSALRRAIPDADAPSSRECWATDPDEVCAWTFKRPAVIMAAGRVGGISHNMASNAEMLRDNAMMAIEVIHQCHLQNVPRLIYLGSSCQYPSRAPQPYKERSILDGHFEPTNAGYALAKSLGVELCRHYRHDYGLTYHSVIPCNLYGPGDNYTDSGHVIGMLLRKFHDAKEAGDPTVSVWGSGNQWREFLHVDDLARAVVMLLEMPDPPDVCNVGSGVHVRIKDLAEMIRDIVGYAGRIEYDDSKPEGAYKKMMDSGLARRLGWSPTIDLADGLRTAYASFLVEQATATAGST